MFLSKSVNIVGLDKRDTDLKYFSYGKYRGQTLSQVFGGVFGLFIYLFAYFRLLFDSPGKSST